MYNKKESRRGSEIPPLSKKYVDERKQDGKELVSTLELLQGTDLTEKTVFFTTSPLLIEARCSHLVNYLVRI
jgi:hypothetical protein